MDQIFETCGLIASFIGTFIEGEFFLLTSAISAKLGYFNFYGGMVAAFFGAYIKDFIKFTIVKKKGLKLLENKAKLKKKLDDSSQWFEKNPLVFLSFYRLMFGFSTMILMLSGLKDISYKKFAIHSAISVGLWVGILGGIGYFCAEVMIEKLNFLSEYKLEIIGGLILIGLVYWFLIKRPQEKYCFKLKE